MRNILPQNSSTIMDELGSWSLTGCLGREGICQGGRRHSWQPCKRPPSNLMTYTGALDEEWTVMQGGTGNNSNNLKHQGMKVRPPSKLTNARTKHH